MSIKQMSIVWDQSQQTGNALLILLKIADHANDFGLAFPGLKRLARAARISERQVRVLIRQMEADGELKVYVKGGPVVQTAGGLQHLNLYRILVGGQQGGEVDFRTLEVWGEEETAQGGEAATSDEPSVEPSVKDLVLSSSPNGQVVLSAKGLGELWNEVVGRPKVLAVTGDRGKKASARLREYPDPVWWRHVLDRIAATPFLLGENPRRWAASFDWLIANDLNAVRVLEGKYDQGRGETMEQTAKRYAEGLT